MKNLVWFCLGVVTGRGLPWFWHIFYIAIIATLWITRDAPLVTFARFTT